MLSPTYPITTERLDLRPYREDDLDALLDLYGREDVTRYLPVGRRSPEELTAALADKRTRSDIRAVDDHLCLVVEVRETQAMVGEAYLFWRSSEHEQGEIGWVLHPDHQGRGYATEAARAMLRLAFEDAGLHRVHARLDARNAASARVAARLGMRQEGHFLQNERMHGEWTDELLYAMLAEEWRQATGRTSARSATETSLSLHR